MNRYDGVGAESGWARVRMIDPELLAHRLRSGRSCTIVDVRGAADFHSQRGHLPHARSIPLAEVPTRHPELDHHRSEPVIVVSQRDGRARLAALELELAGFTEVLALEGGMERWWELGLPIEVDASRNS